MYSSIPATIWVNSDLEYTLAEMTVTKQREAAMDSQDKQVFSVEHTQISPLDSIIKDTQFFILRFLLNFYHITSVNNLR